MDLAYPLIYGFWQASAVSLGLACFWFVLSLILKRNDVADVGWGLGFLVLAAFLCWRYQPGGVFQLVALLIALWGLRLALHIGWRHRGKPEDRRYQKWREEWGSTFYLRSFLQVYLLQAFFQLIIAAPLFVAAISSGVIILPLVIVGVVLWLVGFGFESIGDYQLARFKSDPANKGKLMTTGLWRYTRHPNYFGEITMWWALFLIVVPFQLGWVAIISPLTITWLLLYVSGIPMLEAKYEGREDFEEYKRRTNALFPWWPKAKEQSVSGKD